METKSFFRTFSYREVLSAVMLATVVLATVRTFDYLEMPLSNFVAGASSFLIVVFLHVLYRLEHKRSNTFAGRIIHDMIYLILLVLLTQAFSWYKYRELSFDSSPTLTTVFSLCFVMILIEGLISLLKRLLDFLRWQVL